MRTPSLAPDRHTGFTLLEVMLVMVLLGLAISVVIPSLLSDDSGAILKKEARRIIMLTQLAQEHAVVNGMDMGLKKTMEGYQFLTYQKGQWEAATAKKALSPVKLSEAIAFDIIPGSSLWHEALEWEQSNSFNLEESPQNKPELKPDLFFWASGEMSPAQIELYSTENPKNVLLVKIEEHGVIGLTEGAGQ